MTKNRAILLVSVILIILIGLGIFWYTRVQTGSTLLPNVPNLTSALGGNPGHLSVKGSQILAPNGQPIMLRGFNWGTIADTAQPQDAADNVAQGANFVRIPLSWYS